MTDRLTLGKTERLKSKKFIDQLFSEGKTFTSPPYRIYYRITSGPFTASLQFGTGVSTKNFKKAVDRNRIKRLTREAYRIQKPPLQKMLKEQNLQMHVFFIYTSKELPQFNSLKEKLEVILKKLIKIVNENSSQNT